MTAVPGSPLATITGQKQEFGADASGRAVPGWTINFTTSKGQEGHVFVPQSSYTLANARAAVKTLATEMENVLGATVEAG